VAIEGRVNSKQKVEVRGENEEVRNGPTANPVLTSAF
jgi:hypothetical protein